MKCRNENGHRDRWLLSCYAFMTEGVEYAILKKKFFYVQAAGEAVAEGHFITADFSPLA